MRPDERRVPLVDHWRQHCSFRGAVGTMADMEWSEVDIGTNDKAIGKRSLPKADDGSYLYLTEPVRRSTRTRNAFQGLSKTLADLNAQTRASGLVVLMPQSGDGEIRIVASGALQNPEVLQRVRMMVEELTEIS